MQLSRQHFRLAARSFVRHKGFSIVAVLSLALAIALNTTMYSVIDALVNPPLDVREPEQLYRLTIWGDMRHKVDNATRASLLRTGFDTYESVTYFGVGGNVFRETAVEYGRKYKQASIAAVAPNFFQFLGARPVAGRTFVDGDAGAESQPVVITDALARLLFEKSESPIGKIIDVDGTPSPIIGVVTAATHLPESPVDLYRLPPPGTVLSSLPPNLVRLRKGVPRAAADHQLEVLSARYAAQMNVPPKTIWFQLSELKRPQFRFHGFHYALIGAVIAVLLVACANLANLQLARGIGRSRELALRAALGASRRDIIVQLLIESGMLAGIGLVLGLVGTLWGIGLLEARIPPRVASYITVPQLNWRVFTFAMLACAVCVVIVGLVPAIRVSRVDPNELLKAGAGTGANRASRRQYGVMVVAEIGLALVLLTGAAVVVRSALRLNAVKIGLDIKPLSLAWMSWTAPTDTMAHTWNVATDVVSRVRALPDVEEAAYVMPRKMVKSGISVYDKGGLQRTVQADGFRVVSPSYIRTMRLRLLQGRDFLDGPPEEAEVIIDRKTAQTLWPASDPVGERLKLGVSAANLPWVRVVGVVENVDDPSRFITSRMRAMGGTPIGDVYYLPSIHDSIMVQRPLKAPPTYRAGFTFQILTRSKSDHERMPVTLRHYLHEAGPLHLLTVDRLDGDIWIERASHDFVAGLFSAFAALGIGLASLGIYGLVSHSVAERKREMGVRIALGATSRDVLHAVLREGNVLALGGVALGLLFTKYSVAWLDAFSLEDDRYDATFFAAMAVVLFVVTVLSALVPALRATRIDPVESLRSE